jgi:hypothetical protein
MENVMNCVTTEIENYINRIVAAYPDTDKQQLLDLWNETKPAKKADDKKKRIPEPKAKASLKKHKKLGVLYHEETGFVFKSEQDKTVTGKIVDNKVVKLEKTDVPKLREWKFAYKLDSAVEKKSVLDSDDSSDEEEKKEEKPKGKGKQTKKADSDDDDEEESPPKKLPDLKKAKGIVGTTVSSSDDDDE